MARSPDPKESTIRQLFATQSECARPNCGMPLVDIDDSGNRKIIAEVAHIIAASPEGPRADPSVSREDLRGYENLVLLCGRHHEMVDRHPDHYPAETLRQWKADAEIGASNIDLDTRELRRIIRQLGAGRGGPLGRPVTEGPAAFQIERLRADYRVFAGRRPELAQLDAFLADPDHPYLFIHSPSGRGKTALLVNWIGRLENSSDWTVIFVPISRRYKTASLVEALGTLAFELLRVHGEEVNTGDLQADALRPLLAEFLRREPGRDVVVVLDGLDEALGWEPDAASIPAATTGGIKYVGSARQMAAKTQPAWLQQLAWPREATVTLDSLPELTEEEVIELVSELGEPATTLIRDASIAATIYEKSQGDPLTARVMGEDLQSGRITPRDLARRPPGLEVYFDRDINDAIAADDSTSVLLGLCALAQGPLSAEDLARLAPENLGRAAHQLKARSHVSRYLIGDGSAEAGYHFGHPRFGELYAEKLPRQERDQHRARFVQDGMRFLDQPSDAMPEYVRGYWIAHLAEAGEWGVAREALLGQRPIGNEQRQPWAAARHAAEGSYAGYLGDLDVMRSHAESGPDLVAAFSCALLTASIHSLSTNLHPELPALLVSVGTPSGRWRPEAALEYIRMMPDRSQRLEALLALSRVETPPWPQILNATGTIGDDAVSAALVTEIGPRLPEPLLADAQAAASGINHRMARATALLALAPRLGEPHHATAIDAARAGIEDWLCEVLRAVAGHQSLDALADIYASEFEIFSVIDQALNGDLAQRRETAINEVTPLLSEDLLRNVLAALSTAELEWDGWVVAATVAELAPPSLLPEILTLCKTSGGGELLAFFLDGVQHIPQSLQEEAIEVAKTIYGDTPRTKALIAVASRVAEPGPILQEALEAAQTEPFDSDRAQALIAIASQSPDPERILQEVLEATEAASFDSDKAKVLAAIAQQLPDTLVDQALRVARTIGDNDNRAQALIAIASQAPEPERILQEALDATEAASSDIDKEEILVAIAEQLPESLVDQALRIARTIHAAGRVRALEALARCVDDPAPLIDDALDAAATISDDTERTEVLTRLVRMAPSPQELLEDILSAARDIGDEKETAQALASLAPHLSEALLAQTIAGIRSITDEMERASALAKLAVHLPAHLQADALEITREMTDESARVIALTELAPHLEEQPLSEAARQARAIPTLGDRAKALAGIAPHLPDSEAALDEAVADAREAWDFEALKAIASHAPDPAPILQEAIDAVQGMMFGSVRAAALIELCPDLADPLPAVRAALDEVDGMWLASNRADALVAIAQYLPPPLVDSALDKAREIENDGLKSQALGALVPRAADRGAVVDEALAAACGDDVERRHEALIHVAPYLSDSQWKGALATPLPDPDDYGEFGFAEVVAGLVPHMPDHLLTKALDDICAITEPELRARSLADLLPHVADRGPMLADAIAAAVAAARAITAPELRAKTLADLLPHVADRGPVLADALAAARAITAPELRARTLAGLAPYADERGPVLADALAAACEIYSGEERADVLAVIGEQAKSWTGGADTYLSTLRSLARFSRAGLLSSWIAVEPWAAALHNDRDLEDLANAIAGVANLRW